MYRIGTIFQDCARTRLVLWFKTAQLPRWQPNICAPPEPSARQVFASVGTMDLDRVLLNAQVDRDHLIEFVVGDQTNDFLFALRERLKGVAHHVDAEFFFSRFYILIRQPTHGLTQTLGFDGLLAEVARTFCSAITAMEMSPWPVRNTIGRSIPRRSISS